MFKGSEGVLLIIAIAAGVVGRLETVIERDSAAAAAMRGLCWLLVGALAIRVAVIFF
jgi:hypothetical protein